MDFLKKYIYIYSFYYFKFYGFYYFKFYGFRFLISFEMIFIYV